MLKRKALMESISSNLHSFLKKIGKNLSLPDKKFLRDATIGLLGAGNPFFEKAGMTAYTTGMPVRCVQLSEAFSMVGVESKGLIDPREVQRKLDGLGAVESEFIEFQIGLFLQAYGKRRLMGAGLERTRFVVSKLTERPVYYVWFNPEMALSV
jgi:hypothetical protein